MTLLGQSNARIQLADRHLTYIASGAYTYDVYHDEGGPQLGTVYRSMNGWTADCHRGGECHRAHGRTRWEAALSLWPEEMFS